MVHLIKFLRIFMYEIKIIGFLVITEEELKRLRAAIAGDGAYHEIGFSYDNESEKYVEPEISKSDEPEDELYEAPAGLNVPKGMEVPYNMKIHAIIEKTAAFISEQGGQMEIIIKMKQHANPQFAFMHLDNPLYPYYKFLTKEIKAGIYKPAQTRKVSRSEDEDEDGHYLHPSLLSGKSESVPKFTVPSINFRRSHDDSYSVLVRNLQQQFAEEKAQESPKEDTASPGNAIVDNYCDNISHEDISSLSVEHVIIPPVEVQPIIIKMAEYVAKNGEDFEIVVKSKNDKRFEFLESSSEFYNYYVQLRDEAKLRFTAPPSQCIENPPNTEIEYAAQNETPSSCSQPSLYNVNNTVPVTQELECQQSSLNVSAESDYLCSQESQGSLITEQAYNGIQDEQENSMDSVDSADLSKSKDSKSKSGKVLKGPISFSLKAKEAEAAASEKSKVLPLLLDDDSDEENSGEGTKDKNEISKQKKSTDEARALSNSRHDAVDSEEKPSKVSSSEMEAKLAEERLKDKLLSAARERLVQQKKEKRLLMEQQKREEQERKERLLKLEHQRKEKQLQLERKKKAALFLKMLKRRDLDSSPTLKVGNEKKKRTDKSGSWNKNNTQNGILFPKMDVSNTTKLPLPGIMYDWSPSSASGESGEEIMITEFCSDPDAVPPPEVENKSEIIEEPKPEHSSPAKHDHKKKRKKHTRSKSRERHSKSKSKDKYRSHSPRSHKYEKSKKEKELPAAYALSHRSRSRSRSPRRYYRQSPSYWNRRR